MYEARKGRKQISKLSVNCTAFLPEKKCDQIDKKFEVE